MTQTISVQDVSANLPGYGKREQRADRRAGRRDGRNQIPSLSEILALIEAGNQHLISTAYTDRLYTHGLTVMHNELLGFNQRTHRATSALAELRETLKSQRRAVIEATAGVVAAELPLTPAELEPRNPAEERRSPVQLRLRRETMRRRRITLAQEHRDARKQRVAELQAQIRSTVQSIDSQYAMACRLAWRTAEHMHHRVATYWEGVTLTHPDGRHLAILLPHFRPVLPDWVLTPNVTVGRPDDGGPDDSGPDDSAADGMADAQPAGADDPVTMSEGSR